ncbi:MAG TPA: hypothetical protein VMH50_13250 [Thermoleophilia bacterium]|nr:hypothetical protein [Thermoleophilia bacterium]
MDAHEPISRLRGPALDAALRLHSDLMAEARTIVDHGNEAGVVLRLTGGLAVRHYAIDLEFAEREYSDIDLIGLKRQVVEIGEVFRGLGYVENKHVAMATMNGQLQFFVPEGDLTAAEADGALPVVTETPPSDHIDVFLDAMRMDHDLDFRDRLEINTYAIDPADVFLSKLQIVNLNEKDVHDVITLVKDVYVDFQPRPGVLDLHHVAETCATDWGLYIDVMNNIDTVVDYVGDYDLSPRDAARVRRTLELAQDMMTEQAKTLRWRLRARIGKRVRWYSEVEEQFGGRTEDAGVAVRTKAGRAAG